MSERIHAYLDGDLPRARLTGAELAELDAFERTIGTIVDTVHAEHASAAPDLTARIMAALPPHAAPSRSLHERIARLGRQAVAWVWAPRRLELRLRPAYAFAGIMALIVLVTQLPLPQRAGTESASFAQAGATEKPAVYVQFRLDAPDASRVALAGSFTNWQPRHELWETAPGVWSVVVPLTPGVHDYTFVVNGSEWVADPHAYRVDDSFGGSNSRITLLPPSSDT
ncbi:MAG: hypothetical protein H0X65_17580 [Gemmatimonadetes bacterium]|nr:hypothetical protein [Gemmatimonadota bacterium]